MYEGGGTDCKYIDRWEIATAWRVYGRTWDSYLEALETLVPLEAAYLAKKEINDTAALAKAAVTVELNAEKSKLDVATAAGTIGIFLIPFQTAINAV